MHRFLLSSSVVCIVTVSTSLAQLPSFSLDDFAVGPLTSPPGLGIGRGAEDPFGLGTFGAAPGAPSPTLGAVPGMDADFFTAGPAGVGLDVAMSPIYGELFSYVDAVSANTFVGATASSVHMIYSVDRVTVGSTGSAVANQAGLNQQPSDLYHSVFNFTHPNNFVGTAVAGPGFNGQLPPAMTGPGGNTLLADESILGLTVNSAPGSTTPLNVAAPPISPGSHDNIDAIEISDLDLNGDFVTDRRMYFSTSPDDRTGIPPAFLFHVPPNAAPNPGNIGLFSFPAQMGLNSLNDDIDGLVVWENPGGQQGVADPGLDFALFSLSHGSSSLTGLSEADVFFTDFRGAFWQFANAASLGLGGANDNIDALDIVIPGDANFDGVVDINDFNALFPNLFTPAPAQLGWLLGNFDSSPVIDINDFLIWNANNGALQSPQAPDPVPEPRLGMFTVLILMWLKGKVRRYAHRNRADRR